MNDYFQPINDLYHLFLKKKNAHTIDWDSGKSFDSYYLSLFDSLVNTWTMEQMKTVNVKRKQLLPRSDSKANMRTAFCIPAIRLFSSMEMFEFRVSSVKRDFLKKTEISYSGKKKNIVRQKSMTRISNCRVNFFLSSKE